MLSKKLTFEHLSTGTSVSACILMASIYVGSLYLWRQENRFRRNEPSVIKRRFVSVILSCAVSLVLLYVLGDDRTTTTTGGRATLAEWIGWHSPIAMLSSSLIALFLTAVLFLGPLVQLVLTQTDCNNNNRQKCFFKKLRTNPMSTSLETLCELARRLQDPCFLRNYLISPFTEEFVFRSCMLPLVAPKLLARAAVLTTPLFFGVAHLHHIVEGVKTQSASLTQLLAQHLFQFTYTYIFGVYSSYLFVRTGCFLPTFVIHSFCNFMGFPLVDELVTSTSLRRAKRLFILFSYLAGFLLFFAILEPLTEPSLFHNHLYSAFIVKS